MPDRVFEMSNRKNQGLSIDLGILRNSYDNFCVFFIFKLINAMRECSNFVYLLSAYIFIQTKRECNHKNVQFIGLRLKKKKGCYFGG